MRLIVWLVQLYVENKLLFNFRPFSRSRKYIFSFQHNFNFNETFIRMSDGTEIGVIYSTITFVHSWAWALMTNKYVKTQQIIDPNRNQALFNYFHLHLIVSANNPGKILINLILSICINELLNISFSVLSHSHLTLRFRF